ncbi:MULTISPECIES: hypothetical protein [Pseudarthrobacter]|uniref:hypothetical protein n=1 Tax=Pseudarthrobacter TaxID=1742993 RepID=UPI0013DA7839|nr:MULTISPECIES: hypothetical protein [Pseudarthrobacter]MDQ0000112.1 hypothetical protein [Pseudarthrobacter sulfonivorans]
MDQGIRLDAWVPLFQTGLWVAGLLALGVIFRREVTALRKEMLRRLEQGGPVKIGAWLELGEVRKEVRDIRGQIDDLSSRVSKLFLLTMSPTMYLNLRKLESGHFGPFEANDGLDRELQHLRDLGYIEVPGGVRQLPRSGPDLSQLASITPTGRDFVNLRESLPSNMT